MSRINTAFNYFFKPTDFKNLTFLRKCTVGVASFLPALTLIGIIAAPFIWKGLVSILSKKVTANPSSTGSSSSTHKVGQTILSKNKKTKDKKTDDGKKGSSSEQGTSDKKNASSGAKDPKPSTTLVPDPTATAPSATTDPVPSLHLSATIPTTDPLTTTDPVVHTDPSATSDPLPPLHLSATIPTVDPLTTSDPAVPADLSTTTDPVPSLHLSATTPTTNPLTTTDPVVHTDPSATSDPLPPLHLSATIPTTDPLTTSDPAVPADLSATVDPVDPQNMLPPVPLDTVIDLTATLIPEDLSVMQSTLLPSNSVVPAPLPEAMLQIIIDGYKQRKKIIAEPDTVRLEPGKYVLKETERANVFTLIYRAKNGEIHKTIIEAHVSMREEIRAYKKEIETINQVAIDQAVEKVVQQFADKIGSMTTAIAFMPGDYVLFVKDDATFSIHYTTKNNKLFDGEIPRDVHMKENIEKFIQNAELKAVVKQAPPKAARKRRAAKKPEAAVNVTPGIALKNRFGTLKAKKNEKALEKLADKIYTSGSPQPAYKNGDYVLEKVDNGYNLHYKSSKGDEFEHEIPAHEEIMAVINHFVINTEHGIELARQTEEKSD